MKSFWKFSKASRILRTVYRPIGQCSRSFPGYFLLSTLNWIWKILKEIHTLLKKNNYLHKITYGEDLNGLLCSFVLPKLSLKLFYLFVFSFYCGSSKIVSTSPNVVKIPKPWKHLASSFGKFLSTNSTLHRQSAQPGEIHSRWWEIPCTEGKPYIFQRKIIILSILLSLFKNIHKSL